MHHSTDERLRKLERDNPGDYEVIVPARARAGLIAGNCVDRYHWDKIRDDTNPRLRALVLQYSDGGAAVALSYVMTKVVMETGGRSKGPVTDDWARDYWADLVTLLNGGEIPDPHELARASYHYVAYGKGKTLTCSVVNDFSRVLEFHRTPGTAFEPLAMQALNVSRKRLASLVVENWAEYLRAQRGQEQHFASLSDRVAQALRRNEERCRRR